MTMYEEQVQRIFLIFYGRPADPAGMEYWVNKLELAGGDLESIIYDFGNSQEYETRYGDLEPVELIHVLFQQGFGLDADDLDLSMIDSYDAILNYITVQILNGEMVGELAVLEHRVEVAMDFTEMVADLEADSDRFYDIEEDLDDAVNVVEYFGNIGARDSTATTGIQGLPDLMVTLGYEGIIIIDEPDVITGGGVPPVAVDTGQASVSLSGELIQIATLSDDPDGIDSSTIRYTWYAGNSVITGAVGDSYQMTMAHNQVWVRVSYTDNKGFETTVDSPQSISVIVGTSGGNNFGIDEDPTGTVGPDVMYGFNGTDTLYGGEGEDTLDGGEDDDILNGGPGVDSLIGGRDVDRFMGSIDDLSGDTIEDFSNRDLIVVLGADLSALNDTDITSTLTLSVGNNVTLTGIESSIWQWSAIYNSDGYTILMMAPLQTEFDDEIYGTAYNDLLDGGDGNDTIWAGSGLDDINGDDGDDVIYGEDGSDWITFSRGNDVIDGGADQDSLSHWEIDNTYAVVDMEAGTSFLFNTDGSPWDLVDNNEDFQSEDQVANYNPATFTSFSSIEVINTGKGDNDKVEGDNNDNLFLDDGGANNYFDGRGGNDLVSLKFNVGDDANGAHTSVVADRVGAYIDLQNSEFTGAVLGDTFISIEGFRGTTYNDTLIGDEGNNQLWGYKGNDSLFGNDGADLLGGERGQDTLTGGDGADTFYGSIAEFGGDTIEDFSIDDRIVVADADMRSLNGTPATSSLDLNGHTLNLPSVSGGSWTATYTVHGPDIGTWITGFEGKHTQDYTILTWTPDREPDLSGDDLITGSGEPESHDGGAGIDTISYRNDTSGVDVSLVVIDALTGEQSASGGHAQGDSIFNFENAIGGTGDDHLTGNDAVNVLSGGGGNDTIIAGVMDRIDGGDGEDTVQFAELLGNIYFSNADLVNVEFIEITNTGNYRYNFGDQREDLTITGNTGDDDILGGSGSNVILGGAGDDYLFYIDGDNGNTTSFRGGADNDYMTGKDTDTFDGGDGFDIAYIDYGIDAAELENADLVGVEKVMFWGTTSTSFTFDLSAQTENLIIEGTVSSLPESQNETIIGGSGDDTIIGGTGIDLLTGGDGADQFTYAAQSEFGDTITDFNGADGDALVLEVNTDIFGTGYWGETTTNTNSSNTYTTIYRAIRTLTTSGDRAGYYAALLLYNGVHTGSVNDTLSGSRIRDNGNLGFADTVALKAALTGAYSNISSSVSLAFIAFGLGTGGELYMANILNQPDNTEITTGEIMRITTIATFTGITDGASLDIMLI